jgi:hypothetical protein
MKTESRIISFTFQIHVLIAMFNSSKQTTFPTLIKFPFLCHLFEACLIDSCQRYQWIFIRKEEITNKIYINIY